MSSFLHLQLVVLFFDICVREEVEPVAAELVFSFRDQPLVAVKNSYFLQYQYLEAQKPVDAKGNLELKYKHFIDAYYQLSTNIKSIFFNEEIVQSTLY
jgi:hypothetical protein